MLSVHTVNCYMNLPTPALPDICAVGLLVDLSEPQSSSAKDDDDGVSLTLFFNVCYVYKVF